ncbi:MAG: peptidyl-prolyl cis-trans isomerase, partial [Sphingomicrobium sp.]
SDRVAAAAFGAASGAVVGPIQSDLGWHVIKIDAIQVDAGTSLEAARGASFVEATRPNGLTAADISVGPQTREQFAKLTSERVAAAAFAAASGTVVGPVQSDLGWHVVKIDGILVDPGKSLAAVRPAIAEQLTSDKRKGALADLVAKVEDAIADGSSFGEAVKAAGLSAIKSPLILANGTARSAPGSTSPRTMIRWSKH